PRGNANVDTVVAVSAAQILAPLVIGDVNLGGRVERVNADLPVSAQHDGADIARRHFVGGYQIHRCLAQIVKGVVQLNTVDFAGLEQAQHVVPQAEDGGALAILIAANSFKHRRAVVDHVGHHVDFGVIPGDQLPVMPHVVTCFDSHSGAPSKNRSGTPCYAVGPDVQNTDTEDALSENQRYGARPW